MLYESNRLDKEAIKLFRRVADWLIPLVDEAFSAQIDEARSRLGGEEPPLEELSLWPVIDDYMTLRRRIAEYALKEYSEDLSEEAQIRQFRKSAG